MKYLRSRAGFTLAELVVVLSVVSILAVFAAPAGLNWWQRETVIVLADRFASAISLAQTLSRNQHVWVHLGPLNATQRWKSGWALYQTSAPGQQEAPREPDANSILMTVSPPMIPPAEITFRGSRRGVDTLSYAPVGYSRQLNGAQFGGTLTIASGTHIRRVKISLAGRARICDPANDTTCTDTGADS